MAKRIRIVSEVPLILGVKDGEVMYEWQPYLSKEFDLDTPIKVLKKEFKIRYKEIIDGN